VFVLGHLEEFLRGRAHGQITGLEPVHDAGRTVRVDLDEGRQFRLGPDDLLALAHDPAPYPDHAPLSTQGTLNNHAVCTRGGYRITPGSVLAPFPDPSRARPGGPAATGCRGG